MSEFQNWFDINDTNRLDTPALVIYPERVKYNLELLKSMIDDVSRLRPHIKTHKCKEAAQLTINAGINKFKCATIAEAEMLGMCEAEDVLLAYQPVGPKLNRFINLILNFPLTKFSCLSDNYFSLNQISEVAVKSGIIINVFIDLNVGMNRTGILPGKEAMKLYEEGITFQGIHLLGLHAYDGHIHDHDLNTRIEKCDIYFKEIEKLQSKIKENGFPDPVIIAGGTPTFPVHAKRKNVECSPGTFIYWDKGYETGFKEQNFLPSALILSRVISCPGSTTLCLDVGHKSISAENEIHKRIYFLNAPELKIISQSEEHLVVDAGVNHGYKVGDVLYGLPHHICPTVALYERAFTVENKTLNGEWLNIARDRKINI